MKRILFLVENLGCGGAERVLVNLVNFMDKSKFDVTVMTLFEEGVNAQYLSGDVKLINLGRKKFRGMKMVFKFLPKKLLFRHYLKKCDCDLLVPYMMGVPTFIAAGAPCPKIAWVHGVFYKSFGNLGLKHVYDRFDEIISVSDRVSESVEKVVAPAKKSKVIYNTNDFGRILRLSGEAPEHVSDRARPLISTVGCLEDSKGYDRLINVCAKLKAEGFDYSLDIIGEGIERQKLESQIDALGLKDTVRLLGFQANPYAYTVRSDMFVCSSRTEGLSTAVTEAIILGLPVVSTDVSGAKEILGENNEYGLVVESSENGICEGLKLFLTDPELRRHYSEKAKERAPFFSPEKTVADAEKLFENV